MVLFALYAVRRLCACMATRLYARVAPRTQERYLWLDRKNKIRIFATLTVLTGQKTLTMRKLMYGVLLICLMSFTDTISKASFYGKEHHGKRTASGQVFDMNKDTAAHRSLPFGTKVEVTNVDNGKTVIVVIKDRGPFVKGRSLDLSKSALQKIEKTSRGIVKIQYKVVD